MLLEADDGTVNACSYPLKDVWPKVSPEEVPAREGALEAQPKGNTNRSNSQRNTELEPLLLTSKRVECFALQPKLKRNEQTVVRSSLATAVPQDCPKKPLAKQRPFIGRPCDTTAH